MILISKRDREFFERRRAVLVELINTVAVDVIVKDVALLRAITGLADLIAELGLVCAGARAGGGDDIFLDHYRAHIISTESQRALAELQPLRQPGSLYVLDVVEKQPRNGN